MKKNLLPVVLLLLMQQYLCAQKHFIRDSATVMKQAEGFIKAFNNFEWETFRNFFADDATMFHPQWENAARLNGRKEIEAAWLKIFPEFTDPNDTTTMNIIPLQIRVQIYEKTAVLSFQMGNGQHALSRRTFVWVKQKGEWKIVHIHASNVAEEKN